MDRMKVLLLSGMLTSEHKMERMNHNLRAMLESTGVFTVRLTEEFNGATPRTVEGYDMILLNYDGKDTPTDHYHRLEPGAEKVLFDFVKNGGGLYIHHSACWLDDGLPEEYYKMWGYYLTSPFSRKVPKDDFIVKVAATDPITDGLSPEFMIPGDDLFGGMLQYPEADTKVLLTSYDDIEFYRQAKGWPPKHHPVEVPGGKLENMRGVNEDVPVAWTNHYGKGRVFGCTIGHDIDTYRRFDYLTMFVRACQWCSGREVTLQKPDRRGENRFLPWPYYTPEMVEEQAQDNK